MTSNIGSSIIQDNFEEVTDENEEEITEKTKTEVLNLLRQTVRPEFLNRVDEIIMFHPLMKKQIRGIVKIQLNALKNMVSSSGVELHFSNYLVDFSYRKTVTTRSLAPGR